MIDTIAPPSSRPIDLLSLALSRPNDALERAWELLAGDPVPLEASIARQAIGIVLREVGDIDAAVRELRLACRLARRSGSADREADVLATLGINVDRGQTRKGIGPKIRIRAGPKPVYVGCHDRELAARQPSDGSFAV